MNLDSRVLPVVILLDKKGEHTYKLLEFWVKMSISTAIDSRDLWHNTSDCLK